MSSTPVETVEEENEKHGPKVGIKINLEQAKIIIQRHFPSFEAISITHINRGYNNRVYIVTSINSETNEEMQCILRLSGRFWTRFKTENEVCALIYIKNKWPTIPVPEVYGYCTDKEKSGIDAEYILMEILSGEPLENIWNDLDLEAKQGLADQMVNIYGKLQTITFNQIGSFQFAVESLSDSCGLGVNPRNGLVTLENGDFAKVGKGVEFDGGPFDNFLDYFRISCATEIKFLRENSFMKECDGYEERLERIEKFVAAFESMDTLPEGFPKQDLSVPFIFTHGDIEPRNIMVDKDSMEITGLVDFEFAGSYPADEEWYTGFEFVASDTSEWRVFNDKPNKNEQDMTSEKLAKQEMDDSLKNYFSEQMRKNGLLTPDDIPGHLTRAELYYFRGFICPWWLREEDRDPIPESHYGDRTHSCKRVDAVLNKYGF